MTVTRFTPPPVDLAPYITSDAAEAAYGSEGAKVTRTYAGLTIPDSTFTAIPWVDEDYDDSGYFDAATQPTRLTIPEAGRFQFTCNFTFAANTAGRRIISVFKNGAEVVRDERTPVAGPTPMKLNHTDEAAAGDYYHVAVYQSSGAVGGLAAAQSFVGELFYFSVTRL